MGLRHKAMQRLMKNSSRIHLAKHVRAFASTMPKGALVLDAGAGDQPFRHFLEHVRYEAADFEKVDKPYAKSTYVCDLSAIPVEDARFDFVMFNQTLEHLPEPKRALVELHRVLRSGGKIMCTCPLFYEEHEVPFDFYRYTQFAHRHLFGEAGFTIDRLEWMEGYLGTVAYQMETAARYLPIRPRQIAPGLVGFLAAPLILLTKLWFVLVATIFYRLDIRQPFVARGFPKNYLVIATKP